MGFERRMLSIVLPLLLVRVPPHVGLCTLKSPQISTGAGKGVEKGLDDLGGDVAVGV